MRFHTMVATTLLGMVAGLASSARATPPMTIPFQGALNGVSDGSRTATFKLYDAATAGNAVWTETKSINVTAGRFATALGDSTAFPVSVKFDRPYWVGVTVGTDPEMTPRLPLASVPYALALPNVTVDRLSGYVGINNTNPSSALHVVGNIRTSTGAGGGAVLGVASGGGGALYVLGPGGVTQASLTAASDGSGWLDVNAVDFVDELGEKVYLYGNSPIANYGIGIQNSLLQIHTSGTGSSIAFGSGGSTAFTERMRITGGGRVGIGTSSPTQALDVRGNIKMNNAGDMYAAGGTENLYIVRGLVNANGSIAAGSGFTVTNTSNGHYTIKFTNPEFDQPPSVAITPWTSQPVLAVMTYDSGTPGQPATFSLATLLNGAGVQCGFSFIATAFH